MKGVIVEKDGAPYQLTEDLEVPEPSPDQILVKSLYTAINPIDSMMAKTGLLVESWPFVPGVDASGVVVKVGENTASRFKVGDYVCGCTRLGTKGHSTCQEYFLMDALVAIPKPANISPVEAATIGVGLETAALGVIDGLNVNLPDPSDISEEKHEWVVVLGGSSSVGKFGVQLLKISGYNVIASCSANSAELVKSQGAAAVFDYKKSVEEQVKDVLAITNGNIHRVFDAAATGDAFTKALFKALAEGPKYFSTTNDWSNITDFEGGHSYIVALGPVGRPSSPELNEQLSGYISTLVKFIEIGKLLPGPYVLLEDGGFEDAIQALGQFEQSGGSSKKIVVKIGDPGE